MSHALETGSCTVEGGAQIFGVRIREVLD